MKKDKYKDGFDLLHVDEFEDGGDSPRPQGEPWTLDELLSELPLLDVPEGGEDDVADDPDE